MKLAYARFKTIEKFSNGLSSDEVLQEQHGDIILLDGIVHVGEDCFPLSHVRRFREVEGIACPECNEKFTDARAVGAHRKHKHDVVGARSKGKE